MREDWDPEEARAPWLIRGTNHNTQNARLLSSSGYFIKDPHTASETKELHSYLTCKMINQFIPFTSIKTMIRKNGRMKNMRKNEGREEGIQSPANFVLSAMLNIRENVLAPNMLLW